MDGRTAWRHRVGEVGKQRVAQEGRPRSMLSTHGMQGGAGGAATVAAMARPALGRAALPAGGAADLASWGSTGAGSCRRSRTPVPRSLAPGHSPVQRQRQVQMEEVQRQLQEPQGQM